MTYLAFLPRSVSNATKFSSSSEATLYVFENGKIVSVINDLNNYSSKNLKKLLERFEL